MEKAVKSVEIVRMVLGSFVVYVAMAACSSTTVTSTTDPTGPSAGAGTGTMPVEPSGGREPVATVAPAAALGGAYRTAPRVTTPASTGGQAITSNYTPDPIKSVAGSAGVHLATAGRLSVEPAPAKAGSGFAGAYVAVASAGKPTGDGGAEGTSGAMSSGGAERRSSVAVPAGGPSILNPVPVAKADPVNGKRLRAKYRESEDGAKEFLPGVWFDSVRGEDCSFVDLIEGVSRCLPPATPITDAYTDSACLAAVRLMIAASTACTGAVPKYAIERPSDCGQSSVKMYARSSAYSGEIYQKSGAACVKTTTAYDSSYRFFLVGAEIPLTEFAAAVTKASN